MHHNVGMILTLLYIPNSQQILICRNCKQVNNVCPLFLCRNPMTRMWKRPCHASATSHGCLYFKLILLDSRIEMKYCIHLPHSLHIHKTFPPNVCFNKCTETNKSGYEEQGLLTDPCTMQSLQPGFTKTFFYSRRQADRALNLSPLSFLRVLKLQI